jgi:hypothetical protein
MRLEMMKFWTEEVVTNAWWDINLKM